jgi:hypothetical protein
MRKSTKVVALEQHMDSITVGLVGPGRRPPEIYGEIPSTPEAVTKLARRLDDGHTLFTALFRASPRFPARQTPSTVLS